MTQMQKRQYLPVNFELEYYKPDDLPLYIITPNTDAYLNVNGYLKDPKLSGLEEQSDGSWIWHPKYAFSPFDRWVKLPPYYRLSAQDGEEMHRLIKTPLPRSNIHYLTWAFIACLFGLFIYQERYSYGSWPLLLSTCLLLALLVMYQVRTLKRLFIYARTRGEKLSRTEQKAFLRPYRFLRYAMNTLIIVVGTCTMLAFTLPFIAMHSIEKEKAAEALPIPSQEATHSP